MFSSGLWLIDTPVLADQQRHQLYLDTGCSLEDLPGAMDDRATESGHSTT